MGGTIAVGILLGVGALSNYLVPLMVGASDMAFPRLNAFSFWIAVPAAVLLLLNGLAFGIDYGDSPLALALTVLLFAGVSSAGSVLLGSVARSGAPSCRMTMAPG